jgi:hypothetical protein
MKWICTQIGAREHYAVPRVLHAEGKLESLYTDFWADDFWRSLGWLPGMQGLSTRHHDDLRAARVIGFHLGTIRGICYCGTQFRQVRPQFTHEKKGG